MVDGTPVLDGIPLCHAFPISHNDLICTVKPYIPYDIIPSSLPLPMSAVDEFGVPIPPTPLRVPAWIHEADIPLRQITYSDQAYLDLESVFQSEETGVRPRHSSSGRDLMLLISQVCCDALSPYKTHNMFTLVQRFFDRIFVVITKEDHQILQKWGQMLCVRIMSAGLTLSPSSLRPIAPT
jgi:hypothetical protein